MLKNSEIIFDLKKNTLDPSKIYYKSRDSFHFVCKKGHHFESKASNIFLRTNKPKCKFCKGTKIGFENSLQHKKPNIFQLIDTKKNKNLDINSLGVQSHRKIWWKCNKNPEHSWEQNVYSAVKANGKCPYCYKVWDKRYLKIFLESLIPILPSMTQSERWVFFQQSGILDSTKRNVAFAKQLATQKFPVKEIEKFIKDEPSLVDDILDDPTITSDDYTDTKTNIEIEKEIDEIKLYALGIVEGLIHADEANYVLTGEKRICYTPDLSLNDILRVIDAHYLKNKDLWKNTSYAFLANMALQVAFPCND